MGSEGDSLALDILKFLAAIALAAVLVVILSPAARVEALNLFTHTRDVMEHPTR